MLADPSFDPVDCIRAAIRNNTLCNSGVLITQAVISTPCGPSGGPEVFALLHADLSGDQFYDHQNRAEDFHGFWYAHALRDPDAPNTFLAFLIHSPKLINAGDPVIFLARFHKWMQFFEPRHAAFVIEEPTTGFASAARVLAQLIAGFDPEKTWPGEFILPEYALRDRANTRPYGVQHPGEGFELIAHQDFYATNAPAFSQSIRQNPPCVPRSPLKEEGDCHE